MKKIMLVSFANGSDHQRYMSLIAKGLSEKYKVIIVSSNYYNDIDLEKYDIDVCKIDTPFSSSIKLSMISPQCLFYLRNILKKYEPDLIHYLTVHPYNLVFDLFARKSKRVFSIHDVIPHPKEIKSVIIYLYNWISFRISNYIVVYSEHAYEELSKWKHKACILPLCGQKYTHTDEDAGYVLFFGRIKPYKGLSLLSKSIRILKEEKQKIRFVIAGSGDLSSYDIEGDEITVINEYVSNEETYSLIKKCHCVVLPYISATQSGVIPLVYSFGKPLVITDVAGLREMFIEGTGYVSSLEPIELANKIKLMYSDMDKYYSFQNKIKDEYDNRYSIDNMIKKFSLFYQDK